MALVAGSGVYIITGSDVELDWQHISTPIFIFVGSLGWCL